MGYPLRSPLVKRVGRLKLREPARSTSFPCSMSSPGQTFVALAPLASVEATATVAYPPLRTVKMSGLHSREQAGCCSVLGLLVAATRRAKPWSAKVTTDACFSGN